MLSAFCLGCSSISTKDAKKNLKDAGFDVRCIAYGDDEEELVEELGQILDVKIKDWSAFILARDEDMEEGVFAILFEDKSTAKDFEVDLTEAIEKKIKYWKKSIDKDAEEKIEALEGAVITRGKCWVLLGTTDAIEAFKGK